ncbi:MAG: type I phosphomannose isomerase catalytic subunit [Candidatus Hydrogenedentes bacterium]|nr:type I phosphomannose isomerase catalytic subunit [Candidatus Hydrogenedentota bacterium]
MTTPFGILRFHEQFFERIWGGQRLSTLYGKPTPKDRPIGEAWLISDHPSAPSVVRDGPHAGRTLHDLVVEDPVSLLGSIERLTPGGRFPLLLKILDANEPLSVQVHPDDETAIASQEPDVGKTEMWYVIHAEPGSQLFVGIEPGATGEKIKDAITRGTLENFLVRRDVAAGDSVLVEAGTVHAIGGGILLAEIQQNSDLTYRLYDWNRCDANGKRRELHIEKGLRATNLAAFPAWREASGHKNREIKITSTKVLSLSDYFVTTHLCIHGECEVEKPGQFLILFSINCTLGVSCGTGKTIIEPGSCGLISADEKSITIAGAGEALLYSAWPLDS